MIPQHDLISNIRKKYRTERAKLFRKIINNGTFELYEIFNRNGIVYIANSDYGVFNDTLKILINPIYLRELINSSNNLEYNKEMFIDKIVSPNGWILFNPYDYWVKNYDKLVQLRINSLNKI